MKAVGAGDDRITKCLLNCLRCVMECFERFIRFLTRNTYIQIAITGKNFCTAAKEAFETIWANSTRFTLVGGIGSVFALVIEVVICNEGKDRESCDNCRYTLNLLPHSDRGPYV